MDEEGRTQDEVTEDQEIAQNIADIENLQDWLAAVKTQSGQTQEQIKQSIEDISKDVDALKEVLKALPAVSKAMAQRGLATAKKSIDEKAQAAKRGFFSAIKTVRDKAVGAKDAVVQGVKDYRQGVKDGMEDVEQAAQMEDMYTARAAMDANADDRQWAEARKQEGRSETIVDSVQAAKESSRQRRADIASAKVKVVGFVGKGLVIFGKKDLAKTMLEKVGKSNQRYVEKESRTGKLLQRVAQFGFRTADTARDVRDSVVLGAEVAKDTVIDAATTVRDGAVRGATAVRDGVVTGATAVRDTAVKGATVVRDTAVKGAITLGKGTYKTVGIAAGVVTLAGLETVKLGKAVGRASKEFVDKKIVDPAKEFGEDVKETARDTKDFGSKFVEFAKRKVSQVRDVPTNLKTRASSLLRAAADRVTPTLDEQRAAQDRAELAAQAKEAQSKAFNKLTGREDKDDGAR